MLYAILFEWNLGAGDSVERAELDHRQRVLVELFRLSDIVQVVRPERLDLARGNHGSRGERQIGDALGAHGELEHLETRGAGFVVEVMNLVEVDLRYQTVIDRDDVGKPVLFVLRLDDRLDRKSVV